jgi:hypothetical protein
MANPQRVDRTTRNRDEAKLRTAKKKEIWQALDNEGAGSGAGSGASASANTSTSTGASASTKEV